MTRAPVSPIHLTLNDRPSWDKQKDLKNFLIAFPD